MYEVAFTTGFRDGLGGINASPSLFTRIDHYLNLLKSDPFQRIPNAKRLRNNNARFRIRLGNLRLIYRVERSLDRIVLMIIGQRQDVYGAGDGDRVAGTIAEPIARLVKPRPKRRSVKPADVPMPTTSPLPDDVDVTPLDDTIDVEPVVEWIAEEELWLLNVPQECWDTILQAANADAVPDSVPREVRRRVEDYVTSPANTQLGRIYALGDDDVECITSRPLYEFLIAIDFEQQRVIQSGLNNGPYLVRGGPGTGKSLVGLHAIAKFVEQRLGESLFDQEPTARFGILTYTNTLSDFNDSLLHHLGSAHDGVLIECQTLDKIVHKLACAALGRTPSAQTLDGIEGWMRAHVLSRLDAAGSQLVAQLGVRYVAEEIEKVIYDFDIQSEDEYLNIERRGRLIPLPKPARRTLWSIFQTDKALRAQSRIDSWATMRNQAMHQLMSDPAFPRYNALFVDEMQDLPLTARRLILNLVQDRRHLVMTEDSAQSIYIYPPPWKQVDDRLDFRGRSFVFRRNYRTTREVYRAIAPLRLDSDVDMADKGPVPEFTGPRPVWLEATSADQVGTVASAIRALNKHHPTGNLGVIVRTNSDVTRYVAGLHAQGIAAEAVNKNHRIDLASDAVHVITSHSAKGLEFPAVIVPDVSDTNYPGLIKEDAPDGERLEREAKAKRLLYVALSRACHELVMVTYTDDPSRFLRELDPDLWEHAL